MNRLVKAIIEGVPVPVFTTMVLASLVSGSKDTRYALVKRAIADGDLIRIKKGLYTLSPLYRKGMLNPYCVSHMILSLLYQRRDSPEQLGLDSGSSQNHYRCIKQRFKRIHDTNWTFHL